jgi:hypothetical protein
MPVPLLKRGDKLVGCLVSILPAGPPSQGAVSGTGQALQGDSLPDPAGRVGGEGPEFYVLALKFQFKRVFRLKMPFLSFSSKIFPGN